MSAPSAIRTALLALAATASLVGSAQVAASAQAATSTIFGNTTPPTVDSNDPNSVVLGVKFTSEVPGRVTGLRFYKATTNTGTHIGSVWSSAGTLLASATFSGESASGWQQVTFASPVTIAANATYIASYLAPKGHYSDTTSGFATAGVSSPPLKALANTVSADGVYIYSTTNAFPAQTYKSTNYWVDVLFEATQTIAPGPVGAVTAQAGVNSATVNWSGPTSGGAPIEYKVIPYISSEAQAATVVAGNPPATTTTVTGLKAGTQYSFSVQALNTGGAGPVSSPSNVVTPASPTPPEAPTEVTAMAGNTSATVKWAAPGNGGSTILSYTVTPYAGTEALPATIVKGSPPVTTATVEGLTNGTPYTFRVMAANQYGAGPESLPSNAVAPGTAEPGILMGAEQKAHWAAGTSPCPKSESRHCADEISQSQFVAWPFIAEHTGTVRAIFAALETGEATGAEIGIFANRRYHYAEIEYRGEEENGAREIWTPARFKEYEFEIPPEDPGALLGTSGKVPESAITNNGWTEFKLQTPVRVTKGEKYWLTNTAFQKAYSNGAAEFHKYQRFYHERVSDTEEQPWGNYTNEPHNWEQVARTLKELPSPEQTKINCEKCNTEGWLQEEPKKFNLLNTNRGAQEEGGQTYSYAYGTIEEGTHEPPPKTAPGPVGNVTASGGQNSATVSWSAPSSGGEVTEYKVTPYIAGEAQASTVVTGSPPATTAALSGLKGETSYTFTVQALNAVGPGPVSAPSNEVVPLAPAPPEAPTSVAASAGNASAAVKWTAPGSGGGPILSYTITPYAGTEAFPATTVKGTPPATAVAIAGLKNGTTYTFRVTATNQYGTGPASAPSNAVTPAMPTSGGYLAMDANVTVNGRGNVTTPLFTTAEVGEQLFAFVSSDGPSGSGRQTVSVTGAGLTWTLVRRANSRAGDAEIWTATALGSLLNVSATSTPGVAGFDQSLTVIGMQRSQGAGASATAGAATGASSVSLKTTSQGSLVFAVGHDWTSAVGRTLGTGQVSLHQYLDSSAGDTTWTQYTGAITGSAGETVTMNDTAPANDEWDLAAVEIRPAS